MQFFEKSKLFTQDNIPVEIMKKVREKYVTNPYFDPNLVKKVTKYVVKKKYYEHCMSASFKFGNVVFFNLW